MKNKKDSIRKYIICIILILVLILILIWILHKNSSKVQKIGDRVDLLNISGINVNTKDRITNEPNAPQIGAGMIPIKWDGNYWQITNANDNNWYDYSNGKFATIMLSNGKYVSEERYDMTGKILAKSGTQIKNEEDLGMIFVWIPRLVYTDEQIMYLNGTSIVETQDFKLPKCFTYKQKNQLEMAVKGIWVEQIPKETEELLTQEIQEMYTEENDYGLIRNELIENITDVANKVAKRLQNEKAENKQQILDIDNTNRTMIRIINMNINTPIIANGYAEENTIYINVKYSNSPIEKIISIDKSLVISEYSSNTTMETTENGIYTFAIVDTEGNTKILKVQVGEAIPDFVGFNVDTTYIVLYDENDTEYSDIPIREILKIENPKNDISENNTLIKGSIDFKKVSQIENDLNAKWYDYNLQKWANMVVRNNANVAYFTWIPRYVYWLDNENQISHVTFVNTDNEDKYGKNMLEDETGWVLPDAFKWDGTDIPGYWITKYALSEEIDLQFKVDNNDTILGGVNKIIINNVFCTLNNVTYKIYIYDQNYSDTEYVRYYEMKPEDSKSVIFTDLVKSKYDVKIVIYDEDGHYRADKWYRNIEVLTKVDGKGTDANINEVIKPGIEESVHTGFNQDVTYYVTYDENEQEVLTPVTQDPPSNWYDYENQKWANIVVKGNSTQEAYFVYIPRYIYKLDNARQSSEIKFVGTNVKEDAVEDENKIPDGWTLPDAFKWDGTDIPGYWITKYALSN